ncbi:MAG: hypothetical protein AAF709_22405 [Pseudomonadota bacterium]
MFGGLKYVSRAALVAGAVSLGGFSAQAADLGGNCCADLEERVAELEATTARKGNRKVSLTVSGEVGSNLLWHDSDATDAVREDTVSLHDGGEYSSHFKFTGSAAVTSDVTIGFRLDINANVDSTLDGDDIFVFIRSASLGTLRIGRLDGAADGIHSISLANNIGQMTNNDHKAFVGAGFATRNDFDGDSEDLGVLYSTPTLAGFIFSASYLQEDDSIANGVTEDDEKWSVALRYAGEFGAIRVAAGIGYTGFEGREDNGAAELEEEFISTISVMHVPTGLFLNGAYGDSETVGGTEETGWTIVAGIQQNWSGLGATTLWGQYYDFERDGFGDGINWGLGISQDIDAASAAVYLQYDMYECVDVGNTCNDDANVVTSGIKISF